MSKSIDRPNVANLSQKMTQEDFIGAFLGLDYGLKKIGVALADAETRMAFALTTLANDQHFFERLKEIVEAEKVTLVVLGITKHARDLESAKEKMDFAKLLEKELDLEIVLQEEMFTTKMAQANLKLQGKKNVAQSDDQEAARIILQSWLDQEDMLKSK